MKIGIIGSGEMGRCLASQFTGLGHSVAIANSRGPASLLKFTSAIKAEAASVEDVVQDKDVLVISIVEKNVQDLPARLFRSLSGKTVVIDTCNYYPNLRGGHIPALDATGIDSQWVQEQLGITIVKAFNSMLATSLWEKGIIKGRGIRTALAVSGDSAVHKQIVYRLIEELGLDIFDLGTISESWKQQPGSPIYCRDITANEMKRRLELMDTAGFGLQEVIANRKSDEVLMASDYPAYLEGLLQPYLAL